MRAIDFLQNSNEWLENTRISYLSAGLMLLAAVMAMGAMIYSMAPIEKAQPSPEKEGLVLISEAGTKVPSSSEEAIKLATKIGMEFYDFDAK